MGYTISDALPSDLEGVERIERECFSMPWTRAQLEGQLTDENHIFIVAKDEDGRVLGYVGLMSVLDEGYITNVAVDADHRRQGIADDLLAELEKRGRENALSFLTLEVREHNEAAKALYEKNGYITVGLRKNYYEMPRENAILMTKFFKEA